MQTYKTSDIALKFGLHSNTVRLYEKLGFLPKPQRKNNSYRIFTDIHIEQMKLIRLALKGEVLQNGLRNEAINIIKTSANGDYNNAITLTEKYLKNIVQEKCLAENAIEIAGDILNETTAAANKLQLTRKQAAEYLHVTIDTLRNWEMNGLLTVKRKENGYRIYNDDDIKRLKIIRCLRCANYSLNSILRLFKDLSSSAGVNIKNSINTPKESEEIISVCDRLLTSLNGIEQDALAMLEQLNKIKKLVII